MPINLKNRIFPDWYDISDKIRDPNKDINGKGTLERYNEIIGCDVDDNIAPLLDNFHDNIIVPDTLLERYIVERELSVGNAYALFLGSDTAMRRRVLKYWIRFVCIKGTTLGYTVLFSMVGISAVINELFNTGGFDSATTFDSDTRPTFDSGKCAPCSFYELTLTGVPLTTELYNIIFSIINFNEPINAKLLTLTYNGINLLTINYNWQYDTNALGTHNPVFVNTGNVLFFQLLPSVVQITNTPSINYTSSATKTVNVAVASFPDIAGIDLGGQSIDGALDLSPFTACVDFDISSNPSMASVTLPTSSATITNFDASANQLAALDLSGFSALGGTIDLGNNTLLATLTFNASQSTNPTTFLDIGRNLLTNIDLTPLLFGMFSEIYCSSCVNLLTFFASTIANSNTIDVVECRFNLALTTLDIRNLQGNVKFFTFSQNTSVTTVNVTSTAGLRPGITVVDGNGCTNLTTVDFSTMAIKTLDMRNCTSLTGLTHAAAANAILTYTLNGCTSLTHFSLTGLSGLLGLNNATVDLANCSLVAGDVDAFLGDLVNICITQRGEPVGGSFTGRVVDIDGTNAAPTAIGNGFKSQLQSLNITVNTN